MIRLQDVLGAEINRRNVQFRDGNHEIKAQITQLRDINQPEAGKSVRIANIAPTMQASRSE
jgi:hypothetical protein